MLQSKGSSPASGSCRARRPSGIPDGLVAAGRRVCLCFFQRTCVFICLWVFPPLLVKQRQVAGSVTHGTLLCHPEVDVTQGKLICMTAIKLLTPVKLLFAKASYQLWFRLKGGWNILNRCRDEPGSCGARRSRAGADRLASPSRRRLCAHGPRQDLLLLRATAQPEAVRENTANPFVFSIS